MTDEELKVLKKYAPITLEDILAKTGRTEETVMMAVEHQSIPKRMDMWLFTRDEALSIIKETGINRHKVYEIKKSKKTDVDLRRSTKDVSEIVNLFQRKKSLTAKELKVAMKEYGLGTSVDQLMCVMEDLGHYVYLDDYDSPVKYVYMKKGVNGCQ